MILYNVTVKIQKEIEQEWLQWMREVHIPDVMNTGLFVDQKICRIFEDDPAGSTYAFQYYCKDMDTFQQYQDQHAKALQADHAQRYNNRYVAFRTLMEVL